MARLKSCPSRKPKNRAAHLANLPVLARSLARLMKTRGFGMTSFVGGKPSSANRFTTRGPWPASVIGFRPNCFRAVRLTRADRSYGEWWLFMRSSLLTGLFLWIASFVLFAQTPELQMNVIYVCKDGQSFKVFSCDSVTGACDFQN